jgi:glycosyltransferase involved in cell wall biosynthesis
MGLPRLALIADFPEEGWPSMDLAAEMLLREAQARHAAVVRVERVCPAFRRRLTRLPWFSRRNTAVNADRLLNRFWDYPHHLRRRRGEFDYFHVCDHSYSQVGLELPPERFGVFCHDLDTFRCLLAPEQERRPAWFRLMARRILRGFQRAAVVFHTTGAVRRAIERHGLIESSRLVQAPYGVAAEHTATPRGDDDATLATLGLGDEPFLLHVGSCIPRKRIDVLLDLFATLRPSFPQLRLVKVGDPWTPAQLEQLRRLRIEDGVIHLGTLTRHPIATLYRRAALVVLPSEAEGFGLPVIEALACAAPVLASDLPTLREVGGAAALYCPVGDVPSWTHTAARVLVDSTTAPPRDARIAQAARFTWTAHAETILGAYRRLAGGTW